MYTSILFEDTNSTAQGHVRADENFVGGTSLSTPLLLPYIVLTIDKGNYVPSITGFALF